MEPEYLTINEFPIGATGFYEFQFAGGYLDRAHVKLDFVTEVGARTNYPLLPGMFVTDFTLQIPVMDLPAGAVTVRIYRETPRSEPLINFTNGARLNERNLDRLAQQTIFVAAEAFDAGAFAVAEDLIGQALTAIEQTQALVDQAQGIVDIAAASESIATAKAAEALASAAAALASQNAASSSAGTATAQAALADADRIAAAASAAAALVSQNAASTSAGTATTQAGVATTQAGNASTSATNASSSAGTATTQAGIATTQAAAALASQNAAALSLTNVQSTVANFAGRNKIINGKMDIAQRGTVFSAVASGAYTLDRWSHFKNGAQVGTISQSASVPSDEFQNSILYTTTTILGGPAAAAYAGIRQPIEGYNVRDLIGRTFTLSFWVRSRKTGIHCVALNNSISDRSFIAEYTVNAVNTWEKKSITVVGGLITAGTWNWTNGPGLNVSFCMVAGTTYHTAPNAWQVGNFLSTANQVNLLDVATEALRITGVQLEVGTVASPFDHRLYGQELALCRRYLPAFQAELANDVVSMMATLTSTNGYAIVPFGVDARVRPTGITLSAVGHFNALNTGGGFVNLSSLVYSSASKQSATLFATAGVASFTAGGGTFLGVNNAAGQILFTGCEL